MRSPGIRSVSAFRCPHYLAVFALMSLGLVVLPLAHAQDTVTQSLQKVLTASSPSGAAPGSVTLNGTVEWTAGSTHETGTVQLKSSVDGSTSEVWSLQTQSHSLTQGPLTGARTCTYTDPANKQHNMTDLGCMRVAPWFAPWLTAQLVVPSLATAASATKPTDSSAGVERITYSPNTPLNTGVMTQAELAHIQRATSIDVTYSVSDGLPATLEYDDAHDSEPAHAVKIKVVFSDYRIESGLMVPHHIQRYLQRTLQADILITSVTLE